MEEAYINLKLTNERSFWFAKECLLVKSLWSLCLLKYIFFKINKGFSTFSFLISMQLTVNDDRSDRFSNGI